MSLFVVFGPTTMQCTTINTLSTGIKTLEKAKKRKKKKIRMFTELLQVTSASTKETKTSVKNLKAGKLHDFIVSDGVTVSNSTLPKPVKAKNNKKLSSHDAQYQKFDIQMFENRDILRQRLMEDEPVIFVNNKQQEMKLTQHDLREILESFHTHKSDDLNVSLTGTTPVFEEPLDDHMQQEEIPELEEEIHVEPEEPPVVAITKASNKKKIAKTKKEGAGTFKSKYHKTHEDEIRHKAKSLSFSLYSYVELCIATGMINRGFSTILNYRYKYQSHSETKKIVLNIELYNMVISGFAEKVIIPYFFFFCKNYKTAQFSIKKVRSFLFFNTFHANLLKLSIFFYLKSKLKTLKKN